MEYNGIYRWNFQQWLIKNSQGMNRPKNTLAAQNSDNLNLSLLFLFISPMIKLRFLNPGVNGGRFSGLS